MEEYDLLLLSELFLIKSRIRKIEFIKKFQLLNTVTYEKQQRFSLTYIWDVFHHIQGLLNLHIPHEVI